MAVGLAVKLPHGELGQMLGVEELGGAGAVREKPCTGLRAPLGICFLWPSPPALPRRCLAEQVYIF